MSAQSITTEDICLAIFRKAFEECAALGGTPVIEGHAEADDDGFMHPVRFRVAIGNIYFVMKENNENTNPTNTKR